MKYRVRVFLFCTIAMVSFVLNSSCQPQNPSSYPYVVFPPLTNTPFPTFTPFPTANVTATMACIAFQTAAPGTPCP